MKQTVPTLHDELSVKGHIVLLPGSRSRKLHATHRPGMPTDEVVVGSPCLDKPSTSDETVFQDFLQADRKNDRLLLEVGP